MIATSLTGAPASERLERAALLALHEAAPATVRDRLGLAIEEIDGTLVSITRHDPSIMLNRAIGFGFTRPASAATIETIRSRYRDSGVGRFFLHVHPDVCPPECADLLAAAGLRPHRRWMKFERGTEPPPAPRTDLQVRPIDAAHGEDFGRIVAPAFDLTPAAAGLFPGLIDQPGFHLYMSFDGDAPAGTGLLYIDGEDAWLDWGATTQACRGRGSQRALLARRVEDAIAAGCKRLLTATGEAVPDDPQHSYHNIEWAGFRPGYLRENWVPAGPA